MIAVKREVVVPAEKAGGKRRGQVRTVLRGANVKSKILTTGHCSVKKFYQTG